MRSGTTLASHSDEGFLAEADKDKQELAVVGYTIDRISLPKPARIEGFDDKPPSQNFLRVRVYTRNLWSEPCRLLYGLETKRSVLE